MSTRDIIDDIDALIDDQLAAGEAGQQQRATTGDRPCWHCGRAWHGLAVTVRLEEMRREYRRRADAATDRGEEIEYATSAILDGYRYDEDDSEILCPGSDFIGPMPATLRRFAGNPSTGCTCWICEMIFGGNGSYRYEEQLASYGQASQSQGLFQMLPSRPWVAQTQPAPRWWRLDLTQIDVGGDIWFELDGPDLPTLTVWVVRGRIRGRSSADLTAIQLVPDADLETRTYEHRTVDEAGRPLTVDIHARATDDCGGRLVWHEITGPGGDYVHSRELVPATPHVEWFTSRNLTYLLPLRLRRRAAFNTFTAQLQEWQERVAQQFLNLSQTFRRTAASIEYAYREEFIPEDGTRVGYEIDGRIHTGIARNVETHGDTTTFDVTLTPDTPASPTNRATRRHQNRHTDPFWIGRNDGRRQ